MVERGEQVALGIGPDRHTGDLAQAARDYLAAAADAREHGDPRTLARAALGVHEVGSTTWSGHTEAIDLLSQAHSFADVDDVTSARLLAALARELAHGPPHRERALTTSERAVAQARYDALLPHASEIAVTGGAVNIARPVAFHIGRLAAVLGRPDEALDHLADALRRAERLDAAPWTVYIRSDIARVLLEHGGNDRALAEEHLRAAIAIATGLGLPALAADASRLLEDCAAPTNTFRADGGVWTLAYEGVVVRLPDAKGLRDIAALLAVPGRDIPAPELLGVGAVAEARTGSDPLLDDAARSAYSQRLNDLDEELADAQRANDPERAARARVEREALVDALTAAYGLSGRPRRLGDATERARKTVTARIRDSLTRIEDRHPALGRHLRASLVTGVRCSYRPARPIRWQL